MFFRLDVNAAPTAIAHGARSHAFQAAGIQIKKGNTDYADLHRLRRLKKTICEICGNLRNLC